MTRRALVALLLQSQADTEAARFANDWNKFAAECNRLIDDHSKGLWDAKRAKRVRKMFCEGLVKSSGWVEI